MSRKHRGRIEGESIVRQLPSPAGGVKLETFFPWRLVQRGGKKEVITPLDAPQAFTKQAEEERRQRAAAQGTPMMRALGLAHHWQRLLDAQRVASVAEIAEAEGIDTSQVHRLMRLTLLAPDVVEKLVGQPDLTVDKVLGRPWPYHWHDQRRLFAQGD
ncbi:MAG TPA: hypothetical protein PKD73_07320 [Burkholderiaceae bacterium]|nr:hypothetical protein [Burkholderiaceae bacterium]